METTNTKYNGSVVAFEGPSETISTQLQLLPVVPQILALPNIQSYMKDEGNRPFSARRFVQKVHQAAAVRRKDAVEFLERATTENKRLVFLNGGTVGAQALCVAAISKNETDGDLAKADLIFRGLVKNGLEGLPRRAVSRSWRRSFRFGGEAGSSSQGYEELESQNDRKDDDTLDDPIIRAMRAADALDRETESLQPPNHDIDLTFDRRTRRYSLPIFDFVEKYKGLDPFTAFGDLVGDASDSRLRSNRTSHAVDDAVPDRVEMSSTVCRRPLRIEVSNPPATPSSAEEVNEFDAAMLPLPSPFSDTNSSNPQSPDRVVYGEARLVQMRSSPCVRHRKRARSLDRVFLHCEQETTPPAPTKEALLGSVDTKPEPSSSREAYQSQIYGHKKRPSSCMNVSTVANLYQGKEEYLEVPKTVFVKATPTTISRASTAASRRNRMSKVIGAQVIETTELEAVPEAITPTTDEFETVLPFLEDLSIRFTDGSRSDVLDLVLAGFKAGTYPVAAPVATARSRSSQEVFLAPASSSSGDSSTTSSGGEKMEPSPAQEPAKPPNADSDEYDPFAPHGSYGYTVATWLQKGSIERLREAAQLPTPAQTPPPTKAQNEQKFCAFSTVGQATPVITQNALRSVLSVYFPPEDKGYQQARFSVASDMDSLWKPVFQGAAPGSMSKEGKKIDLILAIGSQSGVRKEYASAITGQIEKLGTKPSGLSRSGRIDLRYLIANSMQSRMAQSVPTSVLDDTLMSRSLLATLLIWHLDVYFATNNDVRFLLLEYPEEHLPTILNLQKLVGSDVMKVAGILDGDDPVTVVPSRSASRRNEPFSSRNNGTSNQTATADAKSRPTMPSPQSSSGNLSFAKANFLLTSNATDSEIATFISTIWKILISASQFYIPEHAPRKVSSGHSLRRAHSPYIKATPLDGSHGDYLPQFSPQASLDEAINGPTSVASPVTNSPPRFAPHNLEDLITIPTFSPMPARPDSPTPSVAPSAKSGQTAASNRDRLKSLRRRGTLKDRNGGSDDKGSVFEWDTDGEDEIDVDERRLMPLFNRQGGRKANTRKALKWLGLA